MHKSKGLPGGIASPPPKWGQIRSPEAETSTLIDLNYSMIFQAHGMTDTRSHLTRRKIRLQ
jgi:hypothetical protein